MLDQADNADQNQQADNQTPEWIGKLPEDLRAEGNLPSLLKFKPKEGEELVSVPHTVVKSYLEVQKKVGQKGVLIPGENASDEDRNNFYKALGRPDTVDGYEFKKPEKMPEGMTWNEERVKTAAEFFHKNGVPKATAQAILAFDTEMKMKENEAQQAQVKEFQNKSVAELRKEWGSEFERKIQSASAAAKTFGGKEFSDLLKATGLDYHPVVIKTLVKIANRVGEHMLVDGYSETSKPVITRDQLMTMMKDRRYMGTSSEQDPAYIKQIQEGWKILSAEKQNAGS